MPQSPHWLQWDAPHSSPKCPFPFGELHPPPPSNTPIPQPTLLITPNGIQIQSAIFPQFTHRTDIPSDQQTNERTNGWDGRQMCSNTRLHSIDCVCGPFKNTVYTQYKFSWKCKYVYQKLLKSLYRQWHATTVQYSLNVKNKLRVVVLFAVLWCIEQYLLWTNDNILFLPQKFVCSCFVWKR